MIVHGTPLVRAGLEAALQAERDLQIVPTPEIGATVIEADFPAASVVVADYDHGVRLAAFCKTRRLSGSDRYRRR
jgi:DNA-binding NarL/FixJ family response regulator